MQLTAASIGLSLVSVGLGFNIHPSIHQSVNYRTTYTTNLQRRRASGGRRVDVNWTETRMHNTDVGLQHHAFPRTTNKSMFRLLVATTVAVAYTSITLFAGFLQIAFTEIHSLARRS